MQDKKIYNKTRDYMRESKSEKRGAIQKADVRLYCFAFFLVEGGRVGTARLFVPFAFGDMGGPLLFVRSGGARSGAAAGAGPVAAGFFAASCLKMSRSLSAPFWKLARRSFDLDGPGADNLGLRSTASLMTETRVSTIPGGPSTTGRLVGIGASGIPAVAARDGRTAAVPKEAVRFGIEDGMGGLKPVRAGAEDEGREKPPRPPPVELVAPPLYVERAERNPLWPLGTG